MKVYNDRVSDFDDGLTRADNISSLELRQNVKKFLQDGYVIIRGTNEFRELASRARKDYYIYRDWETDRKSTRLNSSHSAKSRMPSSA